MDFEALWQVADKARERGKLTAGETALVRKALPAALADFPEVQLPQSFRHPAGFAVSGAPVGTFLRSALLLAGRKALGPRFAGDPFYERVERDLAFGIMRSHFHHGYPKGAHCCVQCTLAVYPVLEAGAIRYFDCAAQARDVRKLVQERRWRFSQPVNAKMVSWALGDA